MMRLLRSELLVISRSLIWWTVGVVAIVLFTVAFFPAVQGSPGFDELMEQLPESVRPLIGTIDITSPVGYLLSQLYLFFLPAVFFVYAIGRGASTIAGEEEAGTLDLLLSQPVSRAQLYVTKVLVVIVGLAVLSFASWLPIQVVGPLIDLTVPVWNLIAVTVQLLLISLLFAAIGLAIAAGWGSRMLGIAAAAAVAFVTYLLDGFGQTIDWLEQLRPITPWYWYDPTAALADGVVVPGAPVLVGASVVITLIGLWGFQRRSLSN